MTSTERRLAALRGPVAPRRHNARTIAALTGNPGCTRRAVLDSASIDKQRIAAHVGYPGRFGQSQFAITRGNAFEARVKENGCAELLDLLRQRLGVPIPEAAYDDLAGTPATDIVQPAVDGGNAERHARSMELLVRAATDGGPTSTLFDHPMLRLDVAGRPVYLEPDLIALQVGGRFHVVEIKSFAVVDEQADAAKVSAAATQSAVYVLAMRRMLEQAGLDPEIVSHEVVLVCPRDFANQPTAALIDVRKQLSTLRRQLTRMARVDDLLARLPGDLSFDLAVDADGTPTRSPAELATALSAVDARYAPECLSACELAYYCRHEAGTGTAALGRSVREALGGIDSVETVLALAAGEIEPDDDQVEAALRLRTAARLRAEALA
ncbi:hypothetical protein [Polymorphospora lycopeni]|uniref:Secreted protein n=1 Tax=Polymorphospora lycopeni TaxID=3140240 RepID=A0ABV5CKI0_9ACTN